MDLFKDRRISSPLVGARRSCRITRRTICFRSENRFDSHLLPPCETSVLLYVPGGYGIIREIRVIFRRTRKYHPGRADELQRSSRSRRPVLRLSLCVSRGSGAPTHLAIPCCAWYLPDAKPVLDDLHERQHSDILQLWRGLFQPQPRRWHCSKLPG